MRNQEEEIAQPPLVEAMLDGGPAVAFAEPFVLNVRMRDAIVGCRRIGIEGLDTIGRRNAQFFPGQPNLEGPRRIPSSLMGSVVTLILCSSKSISTSSSSSYSVRISR